MEVLVDSDTHPGCQSQHTAIGMVMVKCPIKEDLCTRVGPAYFTKLRKGIVTKLRLDHVVAGEDPGHCFIR